MPKVAIRTLDNITNNSEAATLNINNNFKALQEAIENTVSRDGTVPNYMKAALDMNSNRIINAADPIDDNDLITKKYFDENVGEAKGAEERINAYLSLALEAAQKSQTFSATAGASSSNANVKADEASQSADAALSSEQNAKASELSAASSQQAASNSADAARISEQNAKASETIASDSRTEASQSAAAASRSVSSAEQSATDAQNSATASAASASYAAGVEANIHSIVDDAAQTLSEMLNNPFFFGQSMWSDVDPNNASWLISAGQYNAKSVYPDYYDWLLKHLNGIETTEGVSVKAYDAEDITDYDWLINTSDQTFRLPIKTKLASGSAVAGNGMTLGLTNGTDLVGMFRGDVDICGISGVYGKDAGTPSSGTMLTNGKSIGITTDPTKSGIEASSAGLKLYFYVGDTVQEANVINAGAVLNDIANLKARRYITETYHNGTEWYRLWSDGWIEQGGQINGTTSGTLTYLKPYQDTNYTIFMHGIGTYAGTITGSGMLNPQTRTTSSCTYYQDGNVTTIMWQACGY